MKIHAHTHLHMCPHTGRFVYTHMHSTHSENGKKFKMHSSLMMSNQNRMKSYSSQRATGEMTANINLKDILKEERERSETLEK